MFTINRALPGAAFILSSLSLSNPALAEPHHHHGPKASAPIGVMGDHLHDAGEWMVSYRFRHMAMQGNVVGDNEVSPETIVTTEPNRFFGTPGQPPTLRVVPEDMTMDMHMIGIMGAPTHWLTLMIMGMHMHKEMDHITFQGGAGTTRLGTFKTSSKGFGDTVVSGLIRLTDTVHLNAGVSLPTGSITEADTILTPMGTMPRVRLPYAMQLGSGTYDLKPGMTYADHQGSWGWGAQAMATVRVGNNDEGYSLGDRLDLTAWSSYQATPWLSLSARLKAENVGRIDGIDARILAPVQTADPDNYGGTRLDVALGAMLTAPHGMLEGHRLGIEIGTPAYQDLNGPQMETDWTLTVGWQTGF